MPWSRILVVEFWVEHSWTPKRPPGSFSWKFDFQAAIDISHSDPKIKYLMLRFVVMSGSGHGEIVA